MLINTKILIVAFAAAAGILWMVCSLLVALSPGPMTAMTGHMIHMDLTHNSLNMSQTGFVVGLIGWTILASGFAWILGIIYNVMVVKSGKTD